MSTYDYSDPAVRAKARNAAVFLGEPAATEVRALLDLVDRQAGRLGAVDDVTQGQGCRCTCGHLDENEHVAGCVLCLACRVRVAAGLMEAPRG